MNRREFLVTSAAASPAASNAGVVSALAAATPALDLNRHRFGVNYTPSHNWWFCWNDWDPSPIQRDLDAIAALGADHLRIMLVWPFFQPNPKWVSTAHLARLDQLLTLMAAAQPGRARHCIHRPAERLVFPPAVQPPQ